MIGSCSPGSALRGMSARVVKVLLVCEVGLVGAPSKAPVRSRNGDQHAWPMMDICSPCEKYSRPLGCCMRDRCHLAWRQACQSSPSAYRVTAKASKGLNWTCWPALPWQRK